MKDANEESKEHVSKLEALLSKAKSKVAPEVKSLSSVPGHQLNFEDEDYLEREQDQSVWDEELPQVPLLENSSSDARHFDKMAHYQVPSGDNSSDGECRSAADASGSDLESDNESPPNDYLPFPTSAGGSDVESDDNSFRIESALENRSLSLDSELLLSKDAAIQSGSKYTHYMSSAEEFNSSVEDFDPERSDPLSPVSIISFKALDPQLSELMPGIASPHLKSDPESHHGSFPLSEASDTLDIEPTFVSGSREDTPRLMTESPKTTPIIQYEDFDDFDEDAALLDDAHYDKHVIHMSPIPTDCNESSSQRAPESAPLDPQLPWYAQLICCVPSSAFAS